MSAVLNDSASSQANVMDDCNANYLKINLLDALSNQSERVKVVTNLPDLCNFLEQSNDTSNLQNFSVFGHCLFTESNRCDLLVPKPKQIFEWRNSKPVSNIRVTGRGMK